MKNLILKTSSILIVILLITASCNGSEPVKKWTRIWGSALDDYGQGVSVDSSGNSYVAGYTKGEFGGQTNSGSEDAFLTKYNSSGAEQWTRIWGSALGNYGSGTSVDSSGNIYVTGYTSGAFGGQTNAGGSGIFLVKYNSSGIKQWTRIWGSALGDYGRGVSVDSAGNCYVTGGTDGGFGGQTNAGLSDIFLTKYNSSGAEQWTRIWGSVSWDSGNGVSIDSAGNCYVAGGTSGAFDNQTNTGSRDAFLTKYSSSGIKQWTRIWGSDSWSYGSSVSVDSSGNAYVTGYTIGAFDGQTNSGNGDAFLTKYNSTGAKQWTRIWSSVSVEVGNGVSVDSAGNSYVTGNVGDNDATDEDVFLTKYNSSGTKQWIRIWGSTLNDSGRGVSVDPAGNCYVTGYTKGAFDGQTNAGRAGIFLTRFTVFIPPSETFDSAPDLSNNSGNESGNNINAVIESGESAHADNGGPYHSVWWDWSEPPAALADGASAEGDTLIVDTSGSDFDTVLAVYTGPAVNNLTQIAANDNAGPGIITSELSFQFDSGKTYHIVVDGKTASDTGNVVLNYAVIPEPCYLLFIIYYLLFINHWRKLFCCRKTIYN